jgi:hypothetical protein
VKRYALDTLGQQLRRTLPRPLFRLAGALGARVDGRILRRMPAHADGWLGPHGQLLFPRWWRRAELTLDVPAWPPPASAPLTLALDGRRVTRARVVRAGEQRYTLEAAAEGRGALCTIDVRYPRWTPEPATGRRLALRVVRLAPLD